MSWARTTSRTGTPVQITVIDLGARPGSTCTGFVSDLAPADAPHCIEHTCEESFLKMMFPDHRTTRELEKITQPLRTVVKRLGVAPLVPARQAPFALSLPHSAAPTATALHDTLHHTIVYSCKHALVVKDKHGRVVAEHTLRVLPACPAQEPTCEAEPASTDEEFVVKRNLWVFPRVDRLGSVLTNKAAAFSISVPNADNATAGELLFINMTAFCGIRPRAIKLSIRRTMRCRLNAPATRAALPPFRKALITSTSTDMATAPAIVSRSTARYNALSTRAHTLPPGVTIPSVASQGRMDRTLRQTSSTSDSAANGMPARHSSSPVILAASELCDTVNTQSSGSRNGRRSGTEAQQTVEFVATVQRVIIGKPFGHSFDGCFYIRIPHSCFSVKTDMVHVQHHLSVSLRFGMGRSLKKQVPVHIHQMDARSAGPLHVSTTPPGGWQPSFDLAGGRFCSLSECPICFECIHGSRRSSTESERPSLDADRPQHAAPLAAEVMPSSCSEEAAPAEPDSGPQEEGRLFGTDGASTSSGEPAAAMPFHVEPACATAAPGACGRSGDAACSCCSPSKAGEAAAVVAGEQGAGGQVLPEARSATCPPPSAGSAVVSEATGFATSSGVPSDDDSEVNEAVARECHIVDSLDASADPREAAAAEAAAAAPSPQRLPASMSSPVPLVGLDTPVAAGAPGAVADVEGASCGNEAGGVLQCGVQPVVPEWLKEDLVVTDCGHVFHSVCLLRHEHALAARAGHSPDQSPPCPVCRRVYRRYLGAMCAPSH